VTPRIIQLAVGGKTDNSREVCLHHGQAMIRAADLLAINLIIGLCLSATVSGREPRLKDVLSRLHKYLTTYESELATLVAEEHYEQSIQQADGGAVCDPADAHV
jgi:hypothetical protein